MVVPLTQRECSILQQALSQCNTKVSTLKHTAVTIACARTREITAYCDLLSSPAGEPCTDNGYAIPSVKTGDPHQPDAKGTTTWSLVTTGCVSAAAAKVTLLASQCVLVIPAAVLDWTVLCMLGT